MKYPCMTNGTIKIHTLKHERFICKPIKEVWNILYDDDITLWKFKLVYRWLVSKLLVVLCLRFGVTYNQCLYFWFTKRLRLFENDFNWVRLFFTQVKFKIYNLWSHLFCVFLKHEMSGLWISCISFTFMFLLCCWSI